MVGYVEWVMSVSFFKDKFYMSFLVSGLDDKIVKIWDLEIKFVLLEYKVYNVRNFYKIILNIVYYKFIWNFYFGIEVISFSGVIFLVLKLG